MIKIVIAGGRDFLAYDRLWQEVDNFIVDNFGVMSKDQIEIISGGAKGADTSGARYAQENGLRLTYFLAEWDRYGKSAGYRRNRDMADYADCLIAFWDGESKGTGNMISEMRKRGKLYETVSY